MDTEVVLRLITVTCPFGWGGGGGGGGGVWPLD